MPAYRYDHIHLASADPLKAAEFYEKMFGARRLGVRPMSDGRTNVELDLNGLSIQVATAKSQPPPNTPAPSPGLAGLNHFGLLTDNLEAAIRDFKAKGAVFQEELRVVRPGFKISFMLAPDNVLVEVMERKQE